MDEHPNASLLGLPREIRDVICCYVACDHISQYAPPEPRSSGFEGRLSIDDITDVFLPPQKPERRYPSLHQVNKQLHKEMHDNVESLHRLGRSTAEVDLMAKSLDLHFTWTSLPGCLRRGEPFDLNVRLRVFDSLPLDHESQLPGSGNGSHALLCLLYAILIHGPAFDYWSESIPTRRVLQDEVANPYIINNLNVYLSFHDPTRQSSWPSTTHRLYRLLKCFALSGIPYPYIRRISAKVSFPKAEELPTDAQPSAYNQGTWDMLSRAYSVDKGWTVAETCDATALRHWKSQGFEFAFTNQNLGEVPLSGLRRLGTGT